MIQFPNAKINLGLNILRKRADGFHDLETIFYPIALFDTLEFIESNELKFEMSGIAIPGNMDDNIILKAYHLLKNDFPQLPNVNIHLLKNIPTGAGLGGGSADASFMLMALNKHFQLEISKQNIINYAAQLGSDCPFFIHNQPCKATSRGEVLEVIQLNLVDYQFVLVNPKIHVNTGWAFAQLTPHQPIKSVFDIIHQPIHTWKEELINDFEKPIFEAHPMMQNIKNNLYDLGAIYASMSGSGSTLFGIFNKDIDQENIKKSFEGLNVYFV